MCRVIVYRCNNKPTCSVNCSNTVLAIHSVSLEYEVGGDEARHLIDSRVGGHEGCTQRGMKEKRLTVATGNTDGIFSTNEDLFADRTYFPDVNDCLRSTQSLPACLDLRTQDSYITLPSVEDPLLGLQPWKGDLRSSESRFCTEFDMSDVSLNFVAPSNCHQTSCVDPRLLMQDCQAGRDTAEDNLQDHYNSLLGNNVHDSTGPTRLQAPGKFLTNQHAQNRDSNSLQTKSRRSFSTGKDFTFINLTPKDCRKIFAGVSPSGSRKTEARRRAMREQCSQAVG